MTLIDVKQPASRSLAIATIVLGTAISTLANSITSIALPTMAIDLGASPSASIWIVSSYQFVVTVSLLPFASLGDIYGYRIVYLSGLVMFTVASFFCGLAHSLPLLVVFRIAQALGAAGIMSVNSALLRFVFPPERLGAGLSVMTLTVAVCSAAGPSVAAAILSVTTWQWLFELNVPLGLFGVLLAWHSAPRNSPAGHRFDKTSAVLNAFTFGLLVIGLNGLGEGANPLLVAGALAAGIAAGIVFVRRQKDLAAPMLPVDLFRVPAFALSIATSICTYAAQTIAQISLPFYFQVVGGVSQATVGLMLTPWPAVIMIVAPVSGRLSDRYPAGLLCGVGLAILAVGLALMLQIAPDASLMDVAWRMAICGIGFGFFQSPNVRAIVSAAPRNRSGVASGMMSTARLTGQTIGGVVVTMVFGFTHGDVAQGVRIALTVAVAASAVACVLSFLRLRPGGGQGQGQGQGQAASAN
jgi:MFS transporter, DHA2 family, multidrug resistance protein